MDAFTLEELLDLEHAGWRSLCESRGGTYYGELMMPDALFILADGSTMSRGEIAESLDGMPGWDAYEISDATLLPLGPDAAALTYRATSSRSGLAEPFTALMSSVYRRVDGRPRLALYQQTPTSA
ncbi:MAG TPA: nuclear transport factor 2 family protein [Candidatus Corynebacterium avicola]|uniref:Nuclear transport factor 2 family protein n=1 Tax=Candidatus Corynebacterium avicola TaxID=2838527 RepID=A0A9D1RRJ7_9CORY|nr:nuclear transport factor 2 family protein [Candidatus Corynebacterium avicola]